MKTYSDLEYLRLNKFQKFLYKVARFFVGIPRWFLNLFKKIGKFFAKLGIRVKDEAVDVFMTFKNGDWKTRLSYVIVGFGNIARGQFLRGFLFLIFEIVFIIYTALYGWYWIAQMGTLGTQGPVKRYDPIWDVYVTEYHDDSFKILLYSILSLFFIAAFLYTWRLNIKQNAIAQDIMDTPARKALQKECKGEVQNYLSSHPEYEKPESEKVKQTISKINEKYDALIAGLKPDNRKAYKQMVKENNALRAAEIKELKKQNKAELQEKLASIETKQERKDLIDKNKEALRESIAEIEMKYGDKASEFSRDFNLNYRHEKRELEAERKFLIKHACEGKDICDIKNEYRKKINACGKPLVSDKQDVEAMLDNQFHKTLLALPVTGILLFTVLPIFFMILVAFTNYCAANDGHFNNLFTWVGLENFNTLLNWNTGSKAYSAAFGEILSWTLIWAFFATFSNYFLGMFVAIMINKKGIKFKKFWRTVLVLTIAIPQFISLLYVSKMFSDNGFIKAWLVNYFGADPKFSFIGDRANPWVARLTVILINIWIGIPYLMLIATGILMNIPSDLYESAQIDGANAWQQYSKITLPYMLFVTGPYLLTSFIGNMNNFNVIYLLTGGAPKIGSVGGAAGNPGYTDLLVTWLFKITQSDGAYYNMASVIGILVFIIVSIISLIVFNIMPSTRNEEDYQ